MDPSEPTAKLTIADPLFLLPHIPQWATPTFPEEVRGIKWVDLASPTEFNPPHVFYQRISLPDKPPRLECTSGDCMWSHDVLIEWDVRPGRPVQRLVWPAMKVFPRWGLWGTGKVSWTSEGQGEERGWYLVNFSSSLITDAKAEMYASIASTFA